MNITVDEAADRLERTPRRIRQLIAEGQLKATKFGRDWLLTEREVDRFAELERPIGRPAQGEKK